MNFILKPKYNTIQQGFFCGVNCLRGYCDQQCINLYCDRVYSGCSGLA